MNEPPSSTTGLLAAIIAVPALIACCVAPAFMAASAAAAFGWFAGFGPIQLASIFAIALIGAYGVARYRKKSGS